MADLNIHVRVTPRMFQLGLIGLLLSSLASELSSENVTLSTYYPAPSGVYTQMLTTGQTWLARDGGTVGVGTASPIAELDVSGAGNAIIHVAGATRPSVPAQGAYVGWNALTGGTGEMDFLNNEGGGTGGFAFFNYSNAGVLLNTPMTISGTGNVNMAGSATVAGNLTVDGNFVLDTWFSLNNGGALPAAPLDVGGGMVVRPTAGCALVTTSYALNSLGGTNVPIPGCGAGHYATVMDGYMPNYASLGGEGYQVTTVAGVASTEGDPNVSVRCCPCPVSGCPSLP